MTEEGGPALAEELVHEGRGALRTASRALGDLTEEVPLKVAMARGSHRLQRRLVGSHESGGAQQGAPHAKLERTHVDQCSIEIEDEGAQLRREEIASWGRSHAAL
jgi:hypothetical protein